MSIQRSIILQLNYNNMRHTLSLILLTFLSAIGLRAQVESGLIMEDRRVLQGRFSVVQA